MARIAIAAAVATLLLLRPRRVSSFPSYQDPFVAGPPILRKGLEVTPCSSVLFANVSFPKKSDDADADDDGPGYALDYHAPGGECSGPWNRVVLRVTGSVGPGVQYDRWGHVELNGVELVRLTTPEPAGAGGDSGVTTWRVERDVTPYSPIFAKSRRGGVRALVGNFVDRTYTGVIHLTAELLFYPARSAKAVPPVQAASYVRGLLSNVPLGGGGGVGGEADDGGWTLKGIKGNETLNATVTLPFRNAVRAHVDLYASAHGCEEFWYTNPPTSYSRLHPSSHCGGGAARELVLYVDGMMAGVAPPFPVMYSGGINPLLWRPQGGIRSFSVSPYFFDVTPFLALLNDGKEHSVSVGVTSNSEGGSWYPNPVLVVYRESGGVEEDFIDGTITLHESSAVAPEPIVVNKPSVPHTDIAFVTTRSTTLRVGATFRGGGGTAGSNSSSSSRYEETYFSVSSMNTNSIGNVVGDTRGVMNATVNSTAYGRNETIRFPYEVWSSFRQGGGSDHDHNTFEIVANVSQGQHRTVDYSSPCLDKETEEGHPRSLAGAEFGGTLVFVHELRGNATYNRSTTEDRTPHVEEASSAQRFSIIALGDGADGDGDGRPCFVQEIVADGGYVDHASFGDGGCTPDWFCSVFDACTAASSSPMPLPVHHDASHAPLSRFDRAAVSAVRHPRQVWDAINVDDE